VPGGSSQQKQMPTGGGQGKKVDGIEGSCWQDRLPGLEQSGARKCPGDWDLFKVCEE